MNTVRWEVGGSGEETMIAYVLFKCYTFSSSGFYLSFYWGPLDMKLENTILLSIYFDIL